MTKLQVLGTGCAKCTRLAENAEKAAQKLHMPYEIEKISDLNAIMAFGVMVTPALAVDGQVKIVGKVPTPDEIAAILQNR